MKGIRYEKTKEKSQSGIDEGSIGLSGSVYLQREYGSATFQIALDSGVTEEEIENIVQGPMPPTNLTIMDYCIDKGLAFQDIKDKLTNIINE